MIKNILVLDFETFYDKEGYSLRTLSTPEYILSPKFQVLNLAVFDLNWPAPKILMPSEIEPFLLNYPATETLAVSHNALFDMSICSWRYDWVPARMVDTLGMVRSLRSFKRNSLGAVAKELFGHDSKGDVLPKVIGLDTQGIKNAGLWPDFCTYAMNDARLCSQIYLKLLPEFPVEEQKVMDLVLRCAVEPVLHADVPLLQTHLDELRKRKAQLLRESGYGRACLMSTAQFREALEDLGVEIKTKLSATNKIVPQFSKTDPFMAELLEYDQEDDDTNYKVQTLAMARLSHRSTIEESRCQKFIDIAKLPWPDGQPLLPVPLRFGGAHTGRLSGEWGMNLQNLPRDKTKSKLRSALLAPPGHKLITADLAQIEARIVATMCGQNDLLQQFRAGTDVYAGFASIVFQRPITKQANPHERFLGKTAILGLGYGCGAERFYKMVTTQAHQAGIPLEGLFDPEIAQKTVNTYRSTFSKIAAKWRYLDGKLAQFINTSNPTQEAAWDAKTWGPVTFSSGRIGLPNGMALRYTIGDQSLYGARLLENVVQALARIVVMQAAVRLAGQGLRFVLQAHDELVFAVPDDQVEAAKKTIETEMIREPAWLPGLPLAVEIGTGHNYGECK